MSIGSIDNSASDIADNTPFLDDNTRRTDRENLALRVDLYCFFSGRNQDKKRFIDTTPPKEPQEIVGGHL